MAIYLESHHNSYYQDCFSFPIKITPEINGSSINMLNTFIYCMQLVWLSGLGKRTEGWKDGWGLRGNKRQRHELPMLPRTHNMQKGKKSPSISRAILISPRPSHPDCCYTACRETEPCSPRLLHHCHLPSLGESIPHRNRLKIDFDQLPSRTETA